eukprot:PhM_4_TR17458/c3_g2_i5/m.36721
MRKKLNRVRNPTAARWVFDFITYRRARVKEGKRTGSSFSILAGVPQGTVLGPVLFSLYVDDLLTRLNKIEGITALMYADDLSILASDQTPEAAANRLRRACCVLESWTRKHDMSINADKSETVLFTLSTHTAEDVHNPSIKLAGRTLRHTKMGENMVSQPLGMRL